MLVEFFTCGAVLDDQSPKLPSFADWNSQDLRWLDSSNSSSVILISNVISIDWGMDVWVNLWYMLTSIPSYNISSHSMAIKNLPFSARVCYRKSLLWVIATNSRLHLLTICTVHLLIGSYNIYSMHGTIAEIPHRSFLQCVSIANHPHATLSI
jgi:hypothetical protein